MANSDTSIDTVDADADRGADLGTDTDTVDENVDRQVAISNKAAYPFVVRKAPFFCLFI